MIRYRTLTVENYKSIGNAMVTFKPGVFSVVGSTVNGEYSSNGSGKSSILQALTLVLYNKDFQGAPLDSISNRFTGKPFKITLLLYVDRDGAAANYEIINDRASKKLTIRKNGKMFSTTTAKSLKAIQDILGMSEATFKFTHYITTNSILELTNNLSNATLFNEVLQVTQLKVLGQDLQEVKKMYMKEVDELRAQFQELTGIRKLLKITDKFDIEDLQDEKLALESEQETLDELYDKNVLPLKARLDSNIDQQRELRIELRHKKQSLNEGECSLCGSTLSTDKKLEEILTGIEQLEEDLQFITEAIESDSGTYQKLLMSYEQTTNELYAKINEVQKDITVGTQLQAIHKVTLGEGQNYSEEHYKELSNLFRHKQRVVDNIDKARDAIRSGRIFENIMKDFFMLVNMNIQKYRKVINLTTFEVEATSYKSGMVIILRHLGNEIPVESLSNGEKARLSLLVLSALLESMQQTTQSDSNFLLFDEATSSFDKSGILELKNLFSHLKSLDQSCFIITHGGELEDVMFDGSLIITKEDNVATATFLKD